MATRAGKIKKTELSAFSNVRATGIIAIDINEGDDLLRRAPLRRQQRDLHRHARRPRHPLQRGGSAPDGPRRRGRQRHLAARGRPRRGDGRAAEGRRDRRRRAEEVDEVEEAEDEIVAADARGTILTVTEKGFGKRTPVSPYPLVHRGGMGVMNIKITDKNGKVAGDRARCR